MLSRSAVFLCFVCQVMVVAAVWKATDRFHPHRQPDTQSYEQFSWRDAHSALSGMRTLGYPLLLSIVGKVDPAYRAVPILAFVAQTASVLVLWKGMAHVVRSPWSAMFVATSMLYSHFFYQYGNHLTPDHLAAAMSMTSVGALLGVIVRPAQASWWVLLVISTFLAYQLRPVYLFLVVFLPMAGVAVRKAMRLEVSTKMHVYRIVQLICAIWLPLLLFCLLRWFFTGHFGVVSFGGANFAGVVTAFLHEDDIKRLPQSVQPLAAAVLEERRRLVAAGVSEKLLGPTLSYAAIENGFDIRTWQMCVPAARKTGGKEWVEGDAALWRLATSIIWLKPSTYILWCAKAFCRGVQVAVGHFLVNPVVCLMIWVIVLAPIWRTVFQGRRTPSALLWDGQALHELSILWLLAVLYFLCKTAAVISTTPPLGRFMDAASLPMTGCIAYAFLRCSSVFLHRHPRLA